MSVHVSVYELCVYVNEDMSMSVSYMCEYECMSFECVCISVSCVSV